MSRILVVEDEAHLADGLRFNLEAEGHAVDVDGDGQQALDRLLDDRARYDAVVLDVMLPGKDGFSVVKELRTAGHYVPVLMLTARRPAGRRAARIRSRRGRLPAEAFRAADPAGAVARAVAPPRVAVAGAARARIAHVRRQALDLEALELHVGDKKYQLTQMECDLLQYLVKNAGKAVSRKSILEDVWDLHEDTDTRAIDNFIVRLRRYLEVDPTKPKHLVTVRGVGYKFVA